MIERTLWRLSDVNQVLKITCPDRNTCLQMEIARL